MSKAYFNNMSISREKSIYYFLFFIAFIFVLYRAIFIPLFVDEIATYTLYVKNGYFSPWNEFRKANNHIVNTILTYISYSIFGNSPISLRLFNVLAFIPFGIYVFKFGKFFTQKITKWAFYLSFLFSLNFLVYFSMTRGYGISFTFVMIGIYYAFQSLDRNKITDLVGSVLAMSIALYSNFSLLLFVCVLGGVLLVNVFAKREFYLKKRNLLVVSLSIIGYLVSLLFALKILFYYKEEGILWWGNLDGFWKTGVYSLMHNVFNTWDEFYIVQGLILICSIIIGVISVINFKFSGKNIFFFLFFLNVLGIIIMARLFEVNYPYQRTGIHLYLFFIGAFCFAIDQIKYKKLVPFFLVPMFLIPIHFILDFNLNHVVDWEEDNLPDSFFEKVKEIESNKSQEYIPSIYIEGTAKSCWDYSYYSDYQQYMPHVYLGGNKEKKYFDYIIGRERDLEEILFLYDSIGTQVVSEFNLYKRKEIAKRERITMYELNSIKTNDEFVEFIKYHIDSFTDESINIESSMFLECKESPFRSELVFKIENAKTKENYGYKRINLFTKDDWIKNEPLHISVLMNDIPKGEDIVIFVYLYNIKRANYILHSSKTKVYKMNPVSL